jgi:ABC-type transport system involved in cytochrome c biogenesis permease component
LCSFLGIPEKVADGRPGPPLLLWVFQWRAGRPRNSVYVLPILLPYIIQAAEAAAVAVAETAVVETAVAETAVAEMAVVETAVAETAVAT